MDAKTLLRDLRVAAGLTQQELADSLGLSQNAIHQYESGKRVPPLATAHRLAVSSGASAAREVALYRALASVSAEIRRLAVLIPSLPGDPLAELVAWRRVAGVDEQPTQLAG